MTKTCSTTAIIWRAHHIIAMPIKKSLENSKTKLVASRSPNSLVFKKIIGKFKDKACGIPITEFIGLKSKMYSYVKDNEKGGKIAKGIKKNVIKNNIKHEDYKNTLINNEQMHHKMKTIRSQRHQLGSYEINKVSLSCFDDKHYIHDNGTSSYAYGHYKI